MFCLQLRADLDVVGVVDLLVDVGDLLGGHVVRGDDLTEETHADLPLDVAEAHVVLGPDANLQTRGSDKKSAKCLRYILVLDNISTFRIYNWDPLSATENHNSQTNNISPSVGPYRQYRTKSRLSPRISRICRDGPKRGQAEDGGTDPG